MHEELVTIAVFHSQPEFLLAHAPGIGRYRMLRVWWKHASYRWLAFAHIRRDQAV